MNAAVWSPPKDARPLATATGAEMPATVQKEQAWRNCIMLDRCCVNRDLSKIANWEELVNDRNLWRSTIHQLYL